MVCALKALMEAPIDKANTGMRSRSSGSMGCACRFCRRTYQQPAARPNASHSPAHARLAVPGW